MEVEYPVGHRHRRQEGIPLLERKFLNSLESTYSKEQRDKIFSLCLDQEKIEQMPVNKYMEMFLIKN